MLLTAVLTACVTPYVNAETPAYSGTVYTYKGHTSNTTELAFSILEYASGDTTATIQGQNGNWSDISNAIATTSGTRNTLKFVEGYAKTITYTFNPISVGGFIVDASGYSITTGSTGGPRNIKIGNSNNTVAYTTINYDFSLNNNARSDATISLEGTQTWAIADSATFTLNAGSSASIVLGGTTQQNGGTVNFSGDSVTGSGNYTINSGKLQNATFTSGSQLGISSSTATFESVTLQSGATLDLSQHTLSEDTAAVSDGLTLNDGVKINMENITEGTTVKLFNQSIGQNVSFIINGQTLSATRSNISESNGSYTFTSMTSSLFDMVWAGGNGTWNTSNTNWNSATYGEGIAFENGDGVSFNSTANVDVAEAVTVESMTVSGAETSLSMTRSNGGYIAGDVTITDGAKLIIGTQTDQTGFIRGSINVTNGTLQFNTKDVTGYNGGANSTQNITIAADSKLILNHSNNETFAGSLILNGTMEGIANSTTRWDLFGGTASLTVQDGHTAALKDVELRVRNNNAVIAVTVGNNASLTVGKISREGTAKLSKNGSGALIVSGEAKNSLLSLKGGSITMNGGGSIDQLGIDADNTTFTFGANNGAETVYTVGEIKTNLDGSSGNRYGSSVIIDENVQVNATTIANSWGLKSLTVNGLLNVSEAINFLSGGNSGETNYINGSGKVTTSAFNAGNAGTLYTLNVDEFAVSTTSNLAKNTTILRGDVDLAAVTLSAKLQVDGGTVNIASTNNSGNRNGTLTVKGGVVNLLGTNSAVHNIGTVDTSVGNNSTGELNIKAGAIVTVNTLWGCSTSAVKLEEDAQLNLGAVNIKGTNNSTSLQASDDAAYSTSNTNFTINNADVTVNSTEAVTVNNELKASTVTNAGTGELTLTNGYNNLKSIHAQSGNINIQWLDTRFQGELNSLTIGANQTIGIHTNAGSITSTENEGTLKIANQGTATFNSGAKLYGNLQLGDYATVTLENVLIMGSTLSLGTDMTLNGALYTAITNLEGADTVTLFSGVDALTLSDTGTTYNSDSLELGNIQLSNYFSNITNSEIYLAYDAETNVVYAGMNVPEPTTATLSLLALTALAARRRRQ